MRRSVIVLFMGVLQSAAFAQDGSVSDRQLRGALDFCRGVLVDKENGGSQENLQFAQLSVEFERNRNALAAEQAATTKMLKDSIRFSGAHDSIVQYQNNYLKVLPLRLKLAELERNASENQKEIDATRTLIRAADEKLDRDLKLPNVTEVNRTGDKVRLARIHVEAGRVFIQGLTLLLEGDAVVDYVFSESDAQDWDGLIEVETQSYIGDRPMEKKERAEFEKKATEKWKKYEKIFAEGLKDPKLKGIDLSKVALPGFSFRGVNKSADSPTLATLSEKVNATSEEVKKLRESCQTVFGEVPETKTGEIIIGFGMNPFGVPYPYGSGAIGGMGSYYGGPDLRRALPLNQYKPSTDYFYDPLNPSNPNWWGMPNAAYPGTTQPLVPNFNGLGVQTVGTEAVH